MLHSGWKTLLAPEGTVCSVVRVEVKGLQNNVRVRQLLVHGIPSRSLDTTLPAVMAQQKACEGEALRVFRLLTSQVLDLFIHITMYTYIGQWNHLIADTP